MMRARLMQLTAAQLGRVEALLPRERELRKTREAFSAATQALKVLTPRIAETQAAVSSFPDRRAQVVKQLAGAELLAGTRASAEVAWVAANLRAEAATALVDAEQHLRSARSVLDRRETTTPTRAERMLAVISRRLEGMAAELAGTLADGKPCQVCGSTSHPQPATPAAEAVDEAAQFAATAETEALRTISDAARARAHEARVEVETLRQRTGGATADAAAEARDRCATEVDRAIAAVEQSTALAAELASLDADRDGMQVTLRELEAEAARVATTVETLASAAEVLSAEIAAELGGQSTLTEAVDSLKQQTKLLEALAETSARLVAEEAETDRRTQTARLAIAEHGFDSVDATRGSALDAVTRDDLLRVVSEHDEARRKAEAVLADLPADPEEAQADDLEEMRAAVADAAAGPRKQPASHICVRSWPKHSWPIGNDWVMR